MLDVCSRVVPADCLRPVDGRPTVCAEAEGRSTLEGPQDSASAAKEVAGDTLVARERNIVVVAGSPSRTGHDVGCCVTGRSLLHRRPLAGYVRTVGLARKEGPRAIAALGSFAYHLSGAGEGAG